MSVVAYLFCFSSKRLASLIFQKNDFALFFCFAYSSPKTSSGSLVLKLPQTLLIVKTLQFTIVF